MKSTDHKNDSRIVLGKRGEKLAWDYLVERGYKILEKNYRCRIGEIDVVAKKGKRLAIIEIRTRTDHRFGSPEESVTPLKQRKLMRLAQWYLKEKKMDSPVSFDVLAITMKGPGTQELYLIENAFSGSEEVNCCE